MNTNLTEEDVFDAKITGRRFDRKKNIFAGDIILDVVSNSTYERSLLLQKSQVPIQNTIGAIHISNDIWFHISKHIPPENVKTFALICRQTAALVNTKHFWRNILKQYCRLNNAAAFLFNGRKCDIATLRYEVIKLLYSCHKPFIRSIQIGYTLDNLIGRSYVSSWHKQYQCTWVMCYKFWNHTKSSQREENTGTVSNWESLAEDDFQFPCRPSTSFEGVVILVISCNGYVPFPLQLLYDNCNGEGYARLVAARQLLTKDIRSINLELDFQNSERNLTTTIRYPSIVKFQVLPWWHPEFQNYVG